MLMGWGQKAVLQDSMMGRNMAARVLRFLCINTPHTRADIFKYNLAVVRFVHLIFLSVLFLFFFSLFQCLCLVVVALWLPMKTLL